MEFSAMEKMLAENMEIVQKLVEGITLSQARWKPDPERWSILEVINHLIDEEREDFRLHLDIMLHNPDQPWPPIDPMGWITSRKYNQRDLASSIAILVQERQLSLAWLETLLSPDWDSTVQAPWGLFKAGDMFVSWVVHDQWHIQQLVQLRRDLTIDLAAPYITQYAGSL